MQIAPIDNMPHLLQQLKKHEIDKIRYAQKGLNRKQSHAKNTINTVMQKIHPSVTKKPLAFVMDILTGISRTVVDENSKPLNVNRLYSILQCMEIINTREVCLMMNVQERQARRYTQAARLAIPFLEREFQKRASTHEYTNTTPHRSTRN